MLSTTNYKGCFFLSDQYSYIYATQEHIYAPHTPPPLYECCPYFPLSSYGNSNYISQVHTQLIIYLFHFLILVDDTTTLRWCHWCLVRRERIVKPKTFVMLCLVNWKQPRKQQIVIKTNGGTVIVVIFPDKLNDYLQILQNA